MTLHAKLVKIDTQGYPIKALSGKYELNINDFVSPNFLFSFAGSLQK